MTAAIALSSFLAAAAATAAPAAGADVGDGVVIDEVVGGLGPVTDFAFLPDGSGAMVILEKDGVVKARRADGKVTVAARFPVDDSSEKGMLGVAVDPAFAGTRRLFLYYSAADAAGGTKLDRHRVVSVTLTPELRIDPSPSAQKVLLRGLRGPANHDGGGLAIGTDGKLYVGVGDTGCNSNRPPEPPSPPGNYFGTCLTNANGKILRIDLDGGIPADNPLAAGAPVTACGAGCRDAVAPGGPRGAPRKEIWAWGLRNPWRLWPDPRTGRLWVGDVGEIAYEEIVVVEKGRHYGWPWREGAAGWPAARCAEVTPSSGACVDPVYACGRGKGTATMDGGCQSITGGVIVDGCPWPPELQGRYLFGDNATGHLWTLKVNGARTGVEPRSRREITRLPNGLPVSIHSGPDGLIYVASYPGDAGRVLRLRPARPVACPR